ncbi:histidinol dehydrogenase [Mailhella massiliensis]|uniref:Histidinol dehydrogenase n=1 Tax=Mailhella massiliensis TaxID=1903261 RepID=A0A921AYX8_9BACT|nr:histidinol dehydrogenase [Mailhella massiliensis]HJD98332.1 histidinol dehydrogenase [Mailhella massiliensis]
MSCRILKIKSPADPEAAAFFRRLAERGNPSDGSGENVESQVRAILADVRERGDAALLERTRAFDAPEMTMPFAVPQEEMARAAASISGAERSVIVEAASHIRAFHEAQKDKSWFITREDGSILGQKVDPVDRAGLYVPGGKGGNTPLISSMLMGAIPAQVAGVKEIAVVTPPRADGTLNPYMLAAAYLLDINEVYRVGGPWSIAALAYGTKEIRPVDVIAGPGNIFVTTAKKLVQGKVGIDMIAGPSEILVLADESANAEWVAADMLSQAEHDKLASAVLVTTSSLLADRVASALERRAAELPRADIARASLNDWSAVIQVPDLSVGVAVANLIAPEHMEVCTASPWTLLPAIRHAGAVFLGPYSPEPVGDYYAGPNHVLPTLGTARHSSALSVQTFCKKTSVIAASREFTGCHASSIALLARLEGLEAHARSVELRS